jgi:hypothetical protein
MSFLEDPLVQLAALGVIAIGTAGESPFALLHISSPYLIE